MSLLVDTSVWSLAFRKDRPAEEPEVAFLARALTSRETVLTTGLVLQELLQGFRGPKAREAIVEKLRALPLLVPDAEDHIAAAELHNQCRQRGVQLGTIDAVLVHLCLKHELRLLTTDRDFTHAAQHLPLRLWRP